MAGFFAISGYLITASRLKLSLARFAWHRFLRIFPAYWVMLAVVAFLLAPVVSALAAERWTLSGAVGYVADGWTTRIASFDLPGTLSHAPFGPAWNGSAWTLWYELLCYVAAGVVLAIPWVRSWTWAAAATTVAAAANLLLPNQLSEPVLLVHLGVFFAADATVHLASDRIPLRRDLLVAATVLTVCACLAGQLDSWGAVPLAYAMLSAGAQLPVRLRTDISYGVYIYAFPLQQAMADLGLVRDPLLMVVAATLLVVPVAWLSWQLVERPALSLKHWQPAWNSSRLSRTRR